MSGFKQQNKQQTPISVAVAAQAQSIDVAASNTQTAKFDVVGGKPTVLVFDPTGALPQLIKIETLCLILAIEKSAAYELVASGALRPPLKFGKSRRAASRWLLSDAVAFIEGLVCARSAGQPAFEPQSNTGSVGTEVAK